eukprot:15092359-Heterocapsa_arctica.AAC.1
MGVRIAEAIWFSRRVRQFRFESPFLPDDPGYTILYYNILYYTRLYRSHFGSSPTRDLPTPWSAGPRSGWADWGAWQSAQPLGSSL